MLLLLLLLILLLLFQQSTSPTPTFDSYTCTQFFHNFFRCRNPLKSFSIPNWIPRLAQPSIPYDLSPPSYQQITKVIRRMKASGSPCPLDKISIIPFKSCPYLRPYLTELFRAIWQSGDTPLEWKKACSILIHKKGDTSDPANFRPITLESVPLKIFTSCLRDSIYTFLQANGFIEHRIQKGFLPKLSGTFEHTAQISSLNPIHWFQFADDAAVITGLENENQFLLNHFTRWCTWADMIIRVDKCSTFGIRKASSSSTQYLPKLTINHETVPTVDIGESFRYLGRHFNYTMDNQIHMSEALEFLNALMKKIDDLSCHPKNKLIIYHRYVLSKLSWHLTIADLSKTWVIQNLDNVVARYTRHWLELPISSTLSTVILQNSKYGINLILPSTKFIQCQTVIRNALKSSPNPDISSLWAATSNGTNIQYDQYRNTKQVLTAIRKDHEDRINHELTSQGLIMSSILRLSNEKVRGLWTNVQQNMPRNILNFMIKYLNNTLPTKKNLHKWSLSDSPSCSFCLNPETLQHIVSSCNSYLADGRYTWRHNSVLLFLAGSFSSLQNCLLYADLPFFSSPSLITGDSLRPDLVLISPDNTLYLLELTVGFETNIEKNSIRKATKYKPLLRDLNSSYRRVHFINLSMSALGIFESSSDSIVTMMDDLGFDKNRRSQIIKKIINISVRCTYYIFCRRSKPWTNPEHLEF